MMNLRGSSWDFIPNDLWCHIVQRFAAKCCNAISFDTVSTSEDVEQLAVFSEHVPEFITQAYYTPALIPGNVREPDTYQQQISLFRFDNWIAYLILQDDFNAWSCGNEGSADELVFWSGERIKIHAVPCEGQVFFKNLTNEERRCLISVDARIGPNLYPLEQGSGF
ncbi:MAG: hypothetical protein COA78_05705 [Blastopirellula sp.]|nr:MAG: hypothetical protein COA78_05705 [Blastopirellula sp.]